MHIASHVTPTMATRRRRTNPVVPGAKRPALRQLQEGRWSNCPPPTTSVPIGPPIRPLIPSGFCYVACFSSMTTRQSTCLSVSTLQAIISPWWNSAPFGGAGPSASFSPMNKWLLWRTVFLLYVTLCASAGNVSSSSERVATFVYVGGSKIFRTGAAICTAVVLAPSTGRW